MAKRNDTEKLDALLASVTDDMLGGDLPQQFHDDSTKVERILLDLVRPDPVQPRRVLPERVHYAFHADKLTPSQALRELVQISQVAARQRGRPFNNLLELLPDPDRDDEADTKLTPEEALLRDLVILAVTIRDDGLVNPITVVDMTQGVSRLYRIETGERRYWAAWLLRDFLPGYDGDGMISCIIVPAERPSVFRQAKENTARSGLSAIAMARQAALLLLVVNGYDMPDQAVTNDFYRQALDLRIPRGAAQDVHAAMGGIDKGYFNYIKRLLSLSDEAMELADRHNLEEKKLRPLIELDPTLHYEIVRQIVDFNLTSKQVQQLIATGGDDESTRNEDDDIQPDAIRLAKAARTRRLTQASEVARALIKQEGSWEEAQVQARLMSQLYAEVADWCEREISSPG